MALLANHLIMWPMLCISTIINVYAICYKWFFVRECNFKGEVSEAQLRRARAPDPNRKGMPRHHRSFSWMKTGRELSKMTLDLTPTKMNRKSTNEGGVDFMTRRTRRPRIFGDNLHPRSYPRRGSKDFTQDGALDPRSWWPPIEDEVHTS